MTTNKNNQNITVVPLGGLGEVGKNMTVIGYNNEYIIVDAGIIFPDETMHGVDVVIPDFSFVRQHQSQIKGLFITHGHEDHIGAVPYFMKEFPMIPVYATKLTAGMIRNKLKYHKLNTVNLSTVDPEQDKITYKQLTVSFFRTIHSVFDTMGIVIDTPEGAVVHTGDFKFDFAPIDGRDVDLQRLAAIGKKGVKLLLSDSTNAEKDGFSLPESEIKRNLENEMKRASGKIVISTFASSLPRVQSILDIAKKLGKKVFVVGNSMKKNVKLCRELGYILAEDDQFLNPNTLKDCPPEKTVVLTTGAQGEVLAGLSRLANGENAQVSLEPNDTVIFSSGVIPGNEKQVGQLINRLLKNNIHIIQKKEIHTSGHGYQEELKLMLKILKPEYFMPTHGEYKMQRKHKELAELVGVKPENIFICENGDVLEIMGDTVGITEHLENVPQLIDNSGLGNVTINVMRDRRRMAEQGLLIVNIKVFTKEKRVKTRFDLKGIAAPIDKAELKREITRIFEERLEKDKGKKIQNRELINDFSDLMNKTIKRRPLIVPMIEFVTDRKEQ